MTVLRTWSFLGILFSILLSFKSTAQKSSANPVYIDKNGILRTSADKKEVAFFGVNYTVPFAYGYRSHKALNVDIEKAIDADVYHMYRLGLNAFRVHVWDVEISDSLGNLLQNEHLRLFDYLLKKLKERNIKILLTPIAFWGNGYPERDEKTIGFSSVYGKNNSVVLEAPIRAQENYLRQFFMHVNPYTGLTYKDDPDIIAMEINNEPKHSGSKTRTKEYINRLAAAVRNTGWTKPVFYNISESPSYADAVVQSSVDGYSFQWYPSGLVKGHELKGNFLPHVDRYYIPFFDTLPDFAKKPRMIYEFDAGDLMQPVMYPAMARSFRKAGFQWATQFAYDPMATAYGNTEYQTHYLNLAYTPAKAISLLIAGKIFSRLPRMKEEKKFPADSVFDVFTISYSRQLSEMNSEEEFYYTGTTDSKPKSLHKLVHIAGTGSSPVVSYEGTGAYFIDRLANGYWRLEVMPDAIAVNDPFQKASPSKTVTAISWQKHNMRISLEALGTDFTVNRISGNDSAFQSVGEKFKVLPGVYILSPRSNPFKFVASVSSNDFYAPGSSTSQPILTHYPLKTITANHPYLIKVIAAGVDSADKVSIEVRNSLNQWKTLPLSYRNESVWTVELPAEIIMPGVINYRVMVWKANSAIYTFPGGQKGDPYAWDNIQNENWESFVAASGSPIELFDAGTDREKILVHNPDWRNNSVGFISADKPGGLVMKMLKQPDAGNLMGFQFFAGAKLQGRKTELDSVGRLVIRGRSDEDIPVHITLISSSGQSLGTTFLFSKSYNEIVIPLADLRPVAHLLLPAQYPSFRPLFYKSPMEMTFNIRELEKIEVYFTGKETFGKPVNIEIEYLWLKK